MLNFPEVRLTRFRPSAALLVTCHPVFFLWRCSLFRTLLIAFSRCSINFLDGFHFKSSQLLNSCSDIGWHSVSRRKTRAFSIHSSCTTTGSMFDRSSCPQNETSSHKMESELLPFIYAIDMHEMPGPIPLVSKFAHTIDLPSVQAKIMMEISRSSTITCMRARFASSWVSSGLPPIHPIMREI